MKLNLSLLTFIAALSCFHANSDAMDTKPLANQYYFKTSTALSKSSPSDRDIVIHAHHKKTRNSMGVIFYTLHEKNKPAYIHSLEVEKKYQKMGLGSTLFLMALADAKKNEVSTVEWVADLSAKNWYIERFGATETSSCALEFNFELNGDPAANLVKYYEQKNGEKQS